MYAKFKAELWILVGVVASYLHVHYKLDFSHFHVGGMWGSIICLILKDSPIVAKLESMIGVTATASSSGDVTIKKMAPMLLAVLALGLGGCSLTPQQIETDTAVAVNIGLNGATIFDKAKAGEIKADAVQVAQAINSAVLPQFQPGPTAAGLLNSATQQATLHLQARLATLKHGPEIMGIIGLLQGPLSGALGATASPTAVMSATARMNSLAFFSGVSQGISAFTGDATLAPPPLPSMPVVPQAVPAAPAPTAAPGTPQ